MANIVPIPFELVMKTDLPENERGQKRLLEENSESDGTNMSKKPQIENDCDNLNSQFVTRQAILKNTTTDDKSENDNDQVVKYFNGVEISNLSKRQLKKYNKSLKWLDKKKAKRAKERVKAKEKKMYAKINNIDLGPSRKELKRLKMENSSCKIGICIDLSFDDLMIDKDMAKTIKQILRVYTHNRRAKSPMQLHLTSFNGRSKEEMSRHHGYENWDIYFHPEDYLELFSKDKLVYLSSESDNIIRELEDDKVYIIGGLVDHNSQKGICYKKAVEQGIAHAQLPIGEYFWMKHRKVLTINQVFEILLGVSEGKSFKEAFELILPKRIEKIATDVATNNEDTDEANSSVESEPVQKGN